MRALACALLSFLCTCIPQGKCDFDRDRNLVDYCNPNPGARPVAECRAHLLDDRTWVTSVKFEKFIPYDGQRWITLYLRDARTGEYLQGEIVEVTTTIGSNEFGNDEAPAAGNLAVWEKFIPTAPTPSNPSGFMPPPPNTVVIHNDTCANFFARIVVRAVPPRLADAGADATDAATDAADAGADAPAE